MTDNAAEEPTGSILEQLRDVAFVMFAYDAYEWTRYTFSGNYRKQIEAREAEEAANNAAMEEWIPAPTAIPFGPFLVVGFLLTVFGGEAMIHAYLAFAHLTPVR